MFEQFSVVFDRIPNGKGFSFCFLIVKDIRDQHVPKTKDKQKFDDVRFSYLFDNDFRSMDVVRLAEKYRSGGVVGIDLAGDEHNYPIEPPRRCFSIGSRTRNSSNSSRR